MPRKWRKAVPEANSSVPHEVGPDQRRMMDLYRMVEKLFDESDGKLNKRTKEMKGTRHRLAGLEQEDARQPRLAIEADVPSNTKTRKRMENVAK